MSTAETVRSWEHQIGSRLDASPLCVMLDVDGTLAPIVPTPDRASVPVETRAAVQRLVEAPGTIVALVSGRAAADAARVASIPGVWVIGNHGFELRDPEGDVQPDERVRPFEGAIARAALVLEQDLGGIEGAIVENKRWTLSVHYRRVQPGDVPRIVDRCAQVARELGLRLLDGKKIVELRPPVDVDKGTASLAFLARHGITAERGAAFYAGDDRTDEDAFRALRSSLPAAVTVRIADNEDPGDVSTAAELVLRSLPELRALLEWLAARRGR